MPLQATSGAASYDGFGGGAAAVPNYIEDVFSTWLYTGNGSTQTITNGIDVTGKGGLIWFKERASQGFSHALIDTARGNLNSTSAYSLASDTTNSQSSVAAVPTSSGFSLSGGTGSGPVNFNGSTYASWTFRKQPKFFDVVTYTGNGSSPRNISHNLGSVPGCIIAKRTDSTGFWVVYHRSTGATQYLFLNTTAAAVTETTVWDTTPTSTQFTVGTGSGLNNNGATYVAYIFAHDAGGFGLTGTDNVISCGSFTTDGSGNATVSLGYEPQWVMVKTTASTGNWAMFDNMRGMPVSGSVARLFPNTAAAESQATDFLARPTATGFTFETTGYTSSPLIYIAIRRGPMKTPTTGTSVFSPNAVTSGSVSTGFPVDSQWAAFRGSYAYNTTINDRLRGVSSTSTTTSGLGLITSNADGEGGAAVSTLNWSNTGTALPGELSGASSIYWNFRRAPGFFDVVCYTGTGSATTQAHNLGVVPELMIVKRRNAGSEFDWWPVYSKAPFNDPVVYQLNTTSGAFGLTSVWNSTNPTASVFSVGTSQTTNASGGTYVAYLFASCPGVSKCGSYTGTGALQTIDCGFTGGARFVLIKRYDNSGDWWVYDSARGITSGNDPYMFLNVAAAEVTGTNYVDTDSTGFKVTAAAPAGLNANGGTYIFLAIA